MKINPSQIEYLQYPFVGWNVMISGYRDTDKLHFLSYCHYAAYHNDFIGNLSTCTVRYTASHIVLTQLQTSQCI